ncbi:unnamed protein product [Mucor circinelloides]
MRPRHLAHIFIFFLHLTHLIQHYTMANEIKVILYMTGILATGYGLMKYTVPDEETMRKVNLVFCQIMHQIHTVKLL